MKLKYGKLLSNFAFNCNPCHYEYTTGGGGGAYLLFHAMLSAPVFTNVWWCRFTPD